MGQLREMEAMPQLLACMVTAQALVHAFRNDRFILGYSGHFGDDLTSRLLDLSDQLITAMSGPSAQRKRLAFLLVEAYQNIIRHRADLPTHVSSGEGRSFFSCRANPAGQDLVAINGVSRWRVDALADQLAAIRGMDHTELKELSMRMLQLPSEGRGAGVGFIEMTRKSGNDLGHMLRGLGEDHALFALAVRTGDAHPHEKIIREAAILHGTVVMNDILLYHAGHSMPGVSSVVADVISNDLEGVDEVGPAEACGTCYARTAVLLEELSPGRRSVCVIARAAEDLLLIQGVETDAVGAAEQLVSLKGRLAITDVTGPNGPAASASVGGSPERPILLVAQRV